ncbi:hypothetical protein RRG08_063548 [Elysia crispata]|uniref:Uncharacterized protein n=1 Tax=Elysia crispata TaxID=231223 RepID=A0AAE1D1Z5_9GAST|nr:hypothetical protein RRG08_063548 [Elysia crispata]
MQVALESDQRVYPLSKFGLLLSPGPRNPGVDHTGHETIPPTWSTWGLLESGQYSITLQRFLSTHVKLDISSLTCSKPRIIRHSLKRYKALVTLLVYTVPRQIVQETRGSPAVQVTIHGERLDQALASDNSSSLREPSGRSVDANCWPGEKN